MISGTSFLGKGKGALWINPPLQANLFPVNTGRKRWEREERPPWLGSGRVAVLGAKRGTGMARASPDNEQPREPGAGGGPGREQPEGQGSEEPSSSSSPHGVVLPGQLPLAL